MTARLEELVQILAERSIPVLSRSVVAMRKLAADEDTVAARDVSRVVLQDPFMTLRVLQFAQTRRGSKQSTDITTVEHAVMMHGISAFLRAHSQIAAVEDVLAQDAVALDGVLRVVTRAQHAAAFASAIAHHRHDVETDEVIIAALLHDLAELMLWFQMPRAQEEIRHLVDNARGLRSISAQRLVLGFSHVELQQSLAERWQLPALLRRLMNDASADHPRVVNVSVATALARHLEHGWSDPALPDDLTMVHNVTGISDEASYRLARQCALAVARQWSGVGVTPVAAWIPMVDGRAPQTLHRLEPPEAPDTAFLRRSLLVTQAAPANTDPAALVAWCLHGALMGLGLRRALFAAISTDGTRLAVQQRMEATCAGASWCQEMPMTLGHQDLFTRFMTKPVALWVGGANREKLWSLLSPAQRRGLGEGEFLLMSIFAGQTPKGLVMADAGPGGKISETLLAPFKVLCQALSQRLSTTPPRPT